MARRFFMVFSLVLLSRAVLALSFDGFAPTENKLPVLNSILRRGWDVRLW